MKGACAERCAPILALRGSSKLPARSRAGRVLDSHLRELHDAAAEVQVSVKGESREPDAEPMMTATARSNFMQTAARSARTTVKTVTFGGGANGNLL